MPKQHLILKTIYLKISKILVIFLTRCLGIYVILNNCRQFPSKTAFSFIRSSPNQDLYCKMSLKNLATKSVRFSKYTYTKSKPLHLWNEKHELLNKRRFYTVNSRFYFAYSGENADKSNLFRVFVMNKVPTHFEFAQVLPDRQLYLLYFIFSL